MKPVDKSEMWKDENDGQLKQCFCFGPEDCEDKDCLLVIGHKRKQEDLEKGTKNART